jgi:hypothetical protein
MGTNAGAPALAFQKWRHFKEAFTPEVVARAISESDIPIRRCLDPFGGSGTTPLAAQFLGVHPIVAEVNPYLADLIEAKLSSYDVDALAMDLGRVLRRAMDVRGAAKLDVPDSAPPTMVEPGRDGRWIFDRAVASRVAALLAATNSLADPKHARLFKVLLGGILVDVSNVVVNGKGRRYRNRWKERRREPASVEQLFSDAVRRSIVDIQTFAGRPCADFTLLRGDARIVIAAPERCDVAVFSPPYPNSFDYTDVYNVELWTLGYLGDRPANRELRQSTLCSHVQIDRAYPQARTESSTLTQIIAQLTAVKASLWHPKIPNMVAGYFTDLSVVLGNVHSILSDGGMAWMVVGDSRYADVAIPTATIIGELAPALGFEVTTTEPFRSMRASAQQGGMHELTESLVVLRKT